MPARTTTPTVATLPGAAAGGAGAYGAVPAAASPQATQLAALLGNIGVAGNLTGLASQMGGASAAGAQAQLAANLPGYAGLTGQASQNIAADLAGQISPDVLAVLEQSGAERGINVGGGPNAQAAILRAMGETSQQRQALGQTELTAAIGRTPTGPAFNPATMTVTAAEQLTQQQLANTLAAAPDPTAAAGANLATLQQALTAGQRAGTAGPTITGGGAPAFAPTTATTSSPWTTGYPNVAGVGGAGLLAPAAASPAAPTTPSGTAPTGPGFTYMGAMPDLSGLGAGFDPSTGQFTGGAAATGTLGAGATFDPLDPSTWQTGTLGGEYDYLDMGQYGGE